MRRGGIVLPLLLGVNGFFDPIRPFIITPQNVVLDRDNQHRSLRAPGTHRFILKHLRHFDRQPVAHSNRVFHAGSVQLMLDTSSLRTQPTAHDG